MSSDTGSEYLDEEIRGDELGPSIDDNGEEILEKVQKIG